MSSHKTLTSFLAPFIHQLVMSGVRDVVISPGSRSTPLTVLFKEHPDVKIWMNVDERSAAFFALGIAKNKQNPVALVCSSGTASANYFPAIIEAKYSEVPLIVLTADRPHELREVGAPQAIDQTKLYGTHVKHSVDLPLPEDGLRSYMAGQASQAVRLAAETPKGPVHLNLPFREPLMPDVEQPIPWEADRSIISHHKTKSVLQNEGSDQIFLKLSQMKRPLIIVGPDQGKHLGSWIHLLAERLQAPVLADPLSQLRAGEYPKDWIIDGYDAFLRVPAFVDAYQADGLIRFGPMPVSKPLMKYIERLDLPFLMVVSEGGRMSDPTHQVTDWINANPVSFIKELLSKMDEKEMKSQTKEIWSKIWLQTNQVTRDVTEVFVEKTPWFEGHAVTELLSSLSSEATLFVGNSMPIRDLDSFFLNINQPLRTLGNRGANGIDGITSTALGLSTGEQPTFLVIGDLSFFHDTNGLMIGRRYGLNLTCLVVNNNGGGIFSFLPQAQTSQHFEELFATPLEYEIEDVAKLSKASYFKAANREELKIAINTSQEIKGLKIIECVTVRDENVALHHAYWNDVKKAIQVSGCLDDDVGRK